MNENPGHGQYVENAFERMEAACRDFRESWKIGKPKSIESILAKSDEPEQLTLFRNLLSLEIELRRRNDESPNSEEYLQRFPTFADVIRQAFFESFVLGTQSMLQTSGSASVERTQTFQSGSRQETVSSTAVSRLGDFLLIRELGRGGFGVVNQAQHISHGHQVALKTLPINDAPVPDKASDQALREHKRQVGDRLALFKREFRTLANINHPNLIGLHSLEKDGETWFFTMDLVDGTDFLSYVRPDGELNLTRLSSALPQLIAGVMALHARRIIHRDLKPPNVMVTSDGRLVILDFGLVFEIQRSDDASQGSDHFAGTPAYAAPEQLSGKHTAASDWYAVGIMLYEALAGERPFAGGGIKVLQAKLREHPRMLPPNEAISSEISDLTMRLLARNPAQRPDPLEISETVSGVAPTQSIAMSESLARSGSLIGREQQLKKLNDTFKLMARDQTTQCIFVDGRSGEGKTALVDHFIESVREDRDLVVLSGRCYDRESVPFKALDGIIDQLTVHLQRLPDEAASELLPDDLAFLVQLFPVLNKVDVIAAASLPSVGQFDRIQVQHRGFMALRSILGRIGQQTPLVLFADDLQWGDSESAEALLKILGGDESPALLFIGTYRSDEADASRFLQTWDEMRAWESIALPNIHSVSVNPLNVEQGTQLLMERFERDDAVIRRRANEFVAKTGGNPYLFVELIGCFDPDSDSFEALSLPEVLRRKLERLPDQAARLLKVIAVSGRKLRLQELFEAAGQATEMSTVTHMRSENLVRMMDLETLSSIDTYHDKIRETVLDQIPTEQRVEMHLAIGETIERSEQVDLEQIFRQLRESSYDQPIGEGVLRAGEMAGHFRGAGENNRALAGAIVAAEAARRQFAFENAANNYELAESLSASTDHSIRFRIALGLGQTLMQLGKYESATKAISQAAQLTNDPVAVSEIEAIEADIAYREGDMPESIRINNRIARRLGMATPASRYGAIVSIVVELLRIRWQSISPFQRKKTRDFDNRSLLLLNVRSMLAMLHYWRNPLFMIGVTIRGIRMMQHIEHPLAKARSQYSRATIMMNYGNFNRGDELFKQSYEIARQTQNAFSIVQLTRFRGTNYLGGGRFPEAVEAFETAESLNREKIPDSFGILMARYLRSHGLSKMGALADSFELSRQVFSEAVATGNDRVARSVVEPWTRACGGKIPFDQLKSCLKKESDDYAAEINLRTAEACWNLAYGRTAEAVQAAEIAVRKMKREWTLNAITPACLTTLARSYREHAASLEQQHSNQVRRFRKKAIKISRWAVRISRFVKADAAAAHREMGLAWDAVGKTRRGFDFVKRSVEIAEQQGAMYELAQSRMVVAILSQKLKLPDADQVLEQAKQELAPFEATIEANASSFVG